VRRSTPLRAAVPALLIACVFLVSACGSGTGSSGAAGTTTTTTLAAPTATVRFGYIGTLSGPTGYLGAAIQDGEKLAISQFDAVNPPVGVALDSVDTAGGANRARSGALRLVSDRVVAVIGPTSGAAASAADPVFELAGIPSITVSAAEVSLAQHRWRFFHRLVPDDSAQGRADGGYLVNSLHAATVAVIDDSTGPSRELSVSTAQAVTSAGARVVYTGHLDGRSTDLVSLANGVLAVSPNAVFFAGSPSDAARVISRLRAGGYTGKFMLGGSDGTRLVADAGVSAEGSYVACACASTAENGGAQAFNAAFLAQFGTSPGPYAAEAYDATNAILQAIQSGRLSPAAINHFLASIDYAGITRTVKFQPDGNWAGDNVYVYRVQSGQLAEVSPAG